MRDILVLTIILGSVPISFFNPYYGVLMWSWIAYFNPHRYAWGVAYDFPVAQAIALPTLLGILFTRKINRQIFVRETALLLLMWIWFVFTTIYSRQVPEFAYHVDDGKAQLMIVSKILLMTLVTILLVTSKQRLKLLLLVTALSLGVRAFAGAIFGFTTGGQFRVYGPPDSFIEDNNAFGLALNVALPMLFFLARAEENRLLRRVLYVAFGCGVVSVILTYSRGGLLGLAVVLAGVAIKTHRKLLSIFLLLAAGLVVVSYAPERWMQRMGGFLGGQLDSSAKQRLITWQFAWNFVRDYPITGGGFEVFTNASVFQKYAPEALPGGFRASGPHSIYFQVLGEHGFVGLGLFVLLLSGCWLTLRSIRRRVRGEPSAKWIIGYTHMVETSLLAYLVSGAFLGLAYFDLSYLLIACTIILKILCRREMVLAAQAREATPLPVSLGEPVAP